VIFLKMGVRRRSWACRLKNKMPLATLEVDRWTTVLLPNGQIVFLQQRPFCPYRAQLAHAG